ncbi:uncharacterized protein LOC144064153 isoform X2 [Stigmatopora argus]
MTSSSLDCLQKAKIRHPEPPPIKDEKKWSPFIKEEEIEESARMKGHGLKLEAINETWCAHVLKPTTPWYHVLTYDGGGVEINLKEIQFAEIQYDDQPCQ